MHQEEFNLTHPVSHTRDPATSKSAERSITDSGVRKTNNQKVHWLVCRWPNWTASELTQQALETFPVFKEMGFDKALIEVRRRLSDMRGVHVERTKEGRRGLLNKNEVTWRAI